MVSVSLRNKYPGHTANRGREERGGRENEGTGFLFPRQDSCDNQEVSTAM